MKKMFSLFIVIAITLNGCAGIETEFSCTATATGSCQTVSEANKLGRNQSKKVKLINSKQLSLDNDIESLENKQNGIPDRTTEKIYKIWIAPYVDDKDNLHKEQIIFFTSEPTQWKGYYK